MVKTRHKGKAKGIAQISNSAFLMLAATVYAIAVFYSIWQGVSHPVRNWDMMGYIGCIISLDTSDPAEIHTRMLAEIKPVVWPRLYEEYSQTNRLSADAGNFYRQLPFYRIKPLYVGAVWLFHKLGAGLAAATWLVSTLSFVIIAGLLALWQPQMASRGAWLLGVAGLFTLGYLPLGSFAGYSTPDALSLALFLIAFMGWMRRQSFPAYAIGNFLCVLARPDALIQVLALTLYFLVFAPEETRLKPGPAAATAALGLMGYLGIQLAFGSAGWSEIFYRGFIDDNFDFSTAQVHITWDQYASSLLRGIPRALGNPRFTIFVALSSAALAAGCLRTSNREWLWLLLSTWGALITRFLLFPGADERYFYCYYVVMMMAGFELLVPVAEALREQSRPFLQKIRKSLP